MMQDDDWGRHVGDASVVVMPVDSVRGAVASDESRSRRFLCASGNTRTPTSGTAQRNAFSSASLHGLLRVFVAARIVATCCAVTGAALLPKLLRT